MDIDLTKGDGARGAIRLEKEPRAVAPAPAASLPAGALPVPPAASIPPLPTEPAPARPSSTRWFGAALAVCALVVFAVLYARSHADEPSTAQQLAPPAAPSAEPPTAGLPPPAVPSPAPIAAPPMPVPSSEPVPAPTPAAEAALAVGASDGATATPSWIVSVAAFESAAQADAFIAQAEREGHGPLSRLWIPDWPSLSGRAFYAVYAGPYPYAEREAVRRRVEAARAWAPGAYGVKLDVVPGREELR